MAACWLYIKPVCETMRRVTMVKYICMIWPHFYERWYVTSNDFKWFVGEHSSAFMPTGSPNWPMNLVHHWNINTSFTLLFGLTTLLPCRPTLHCLICIVKVLWILWCFSFCRLQGAHGSPRHSSIYNNSRSKYKYNGNQFSKLLWHHQTVPITKIVLEHVGSIFVSLCSQPLKLQSCNLPTRSLCGPVSIEFQFQECLVGQLQNPSWCLAVKTMYLFNKLK